MAIACMAAALYLIKGAYPQQPAFTSRLLDFIKKHEMSDETSISAGQYKNGDWGRYVIAPQYWMYSVPGTYDPLAAAGEDDINILSYGAMKLNLHYGDSFFTNKKYQQSIEDKAVSRVIEKGFVPEQLFQVHMEGNIGKRLTLYIDHDSAREENHYLMQYRAVRDDEVIREINAGEIDIKFNHSKYAVYDNTTNKGMGADITLKKNNFQIKAFGSVSRGKTSVEYFRGNSVPQSYRLSEYQYIKRTYYQLEPFRRYDGLNSTAEIPLTPADFYNLVTFTSAPSDAAHYIPFSVGINPSDFEIFMDDQNPNNNSNAISLTLDGGLYTKLQSGKDYIVNFTTGLISFVCDIPAAARIFVLYSRFGGGLITTDPTARTDIFPGRLFVFIKYGLSLHEDVNFNYPLVPLEPSEDTNGDGRCNVDIYEVRSHYFIGSKKIVADNCILHFQRENGGMTSDEIRSMGRYEVDYMNGMVRFDLREPFKKNFGGGTAPRMIYCENQAERVYVYSIFGMKIDYFSEARSFQLKNQNVIPGSIRVKINNKEISEMLYTVDFTTGYIMFNDPNNPLIGPETEIEVKYEYLPFGGQSQEFIGGLRADYAITKNLNVGGSLLYEGTGAAQAIPAVGSEPKQTFLVEADGLVNVDEKSMTQLINFFSKERKYKKIPLEFNAYGEYARSYTSINTFGKGLVDNMESTEDIYSLSLSERDWVPASVPAGMGNNDRGFLFYKFYRNTSNPEELKGLSYFPHNVPYDIKPGPYNVSGGHLNLHVMSQDYQRSLGFTFDFNGREVVSSATRRIAVADVSGLQYMEIWYRSTGGSGIVDLYLEVGKINEDSDGDNVLDTEDANKNGVLDFDPVAGTYEDRGYTFDPLGEPALRTKVGSGPGFNRITSGNGVLDTEDLNGNGTLEKAESVIIFPGPSTTPNTSLSINCSDTNWKMARLYLNRDSIEYQNNQYSYENILKQVEAFRLSLRKNGGTETGTILIDCIRFVTSTWKTIERDSSASSLTVTMIDNQSDEDYRLESFQSAKRDVYKSLYGEKESDEIARERESALKLSYQINGSYVSVSRRFSKPLDLRFYRTMNVWVNYRSFSPGDRLGIVIGSSESDYITYIADMDTPLLWRELELKLDRKSHGNVPIASTTGYPDLKRISYMKAVIYAASPGSSGSLWLNDIYVSEPLILEDDAHWFESGIKITQPLAVTKNGIPLFSNTNIKYIKKGNGRHFNSIGKTISDISEDYHELNTSVDVIPGWNTSVSYVREQSKTDSLNDEVIINKRGETLRSSVYAFSDYRSQINSVPSVVVSYKYDTFENSRDEIISGAPVIRESEYTAHSPAVTMIESVDNFLGGKLNAQFLMNMMFRRENINRSSRIVGNDDLVLLTSLSEDEKRQRSETELTLGYINKYFHITPLLGLSAEDIVSSLGKAGTCDPQIQDDFMGDYHFPFVHDGNVKFVERDKRYGIAIGLNDFSYVAPEYALDIQYHENNFRDYRDGEVPDEKYSRAKDSQSYISSRITIPLYFNKIKKAKVFRPFAVSYVRSLYFFETATPYEGESRNEYQENYGIRRSVQGLSDGAINIFQYYPFYFFNGRGNYGNGRDYIRKTMNRTLQFSGGEPVQAYNNQLKLIEDLTINGGLNFNSVIVDVNGGINQLCQRATVYGVPQQIIAAMAGLHISFDLMKLSTFGFFRENRVGRPYHASIFEIGYRYNGNYIITSNIEENAHTPNCGLSFKWDRASAGMKFGVSFIEKNSRVFISYNKDKRSSQDDIYIQNMPAHSYFHESDVGYNLSFLYETDVTWLFNLFSKIYTLYAYPIFTFEYSMLLNRFDYTVSLSPEPYDMHLITTRLVLDLHQYIQGELRARFAVEDFRSRSTLEVNREIFSYEIGMNFSLLF